MRFFTLLFVCIVSFTNLSSQTVISYTLLKSFTKAQVDSVLTANGIPASLVGTKYDVDIFKVLYRTPYKHPDSLVQASGALVLPRNAACSVPLAMWAHGTESNINVVASRLTGGQWELGIGFAATGYAIALPDFLGMGEKDPKVTIHPYQHAYHEANTSVNILRASREISTTENVSLNGQLFLFGYSQGGYVTAATAKEIQTNLSNEFTVTGAVPMSGSYDIDGAQYDLMKSDSAYATPGYLPFLTLGYNSVLGTLFNDPKDIFKAPYDTVLPPLFYAGNTGIGSINQLCNPVPKKMFKDSIVNAIFADSLHPFRVALKANNLVKGWVPQFPIRLFYCSGDEQVNPVNSEVAYNTWKAGNAPNLLKNDFGNLSHTSCAQFTVLNAKLFFDSLKTDCSTAIKETEKDAVLSVYPNPAQNSIAIAVNENMQDATIEIYSLDGKAEQSVSFSGNKTEVDIRNFKSGIYLLKLSSGSNVSTKRFVKY
jgi:pimeloyl-ACP methyl ester carboxylesterase